jgi:ethanolamine ammonia-lyase small subunit
MKGTSSSLGLAVVTNDWLELAHVIRARTPARILVDRAGLSYYTITQLDLRRDHAFALDAVHAAIDLRRDLGDELVGRFALFETRTQAESKARFLMRPDLGRLLASASRDEVLRLCPKSINVQIVIAMAYRRRQWQRRFRGSCRSWQKARRRAAGRLAGRLLSIIAALG